MSNAVLFYRALTSSLPASSHDDYPRRRKKRCPRRGPSQPQRQSKSIPEDEWVIVDEPIPRVPSLREMYPNAILIRDRADDLHRSQRFDGARDPAACDASFDSLSDTLISMLESSKLIVFLGPSGSGKTRAMDSVRRRWILRSPARSNDDDDDNDDEEEEEEEDDPIIVDSTRCVHPDSCDLHWDRSKAVVSHFGRAADASLWLGRVGLNSVPSWCKPFHVLSTGEAYRASLARMLMIAHQTSSPLLLDSFACHLDDRTASSCAHNLAKQMRRLAIPGILSCSSTELLGYIQPDYVVAFEARDAHTLSSTWKPVTRILCNDHAGVPPRVVVEVVRGASHSSTCSDGHPASVSTPSMRTTGGPIKGIAPLLSCSASSGEVRGADDVSAPTPLVLYACVEQDESTRMCDALFDSAFVGRAVTELPRFPLDRIREWAGDAPCVGVIYGPSGSSKSAILHHHFSSTTTLPRMRWSRRGGSAPSSAMEDVVAHVQHILATNESAGAPHGKVPLGTTPSLSKLVREAFGAVGLPSMACGTFGYASLSTGGMALADVAALMVAHHVCGWSTMVVDECASGIDRVTAVRMVAGMAAFWNKHGLPRGGVVLCGCHTFAFRRDTLVPTWMYDAGTGCVHRYRPFLCNQDALDGLPAAPGGMAMVRAACSDIAPRTRGITTSTCRGGAEPIEMAVVRVPRVCIRVVASRCAHRVWSEFAPHHYKSPTLSPNASCWVGVLAPTRRGGSDAGDGDGAGASSERVAFVAAIPHNVRRGEGEGAPARAHRTVVLPRYQGLGIGSRMSDAVGHVHHAEHRQFWAQTVHPAFGAYRDASPLWEPTRWNRTTRKYRVENWAQRVNGVRIRLRHPRYVYSHRYVGPGDSASAREHLRSRVRFIQRKQAER